MAVGQQFAGVALDSAGVAIADGVNNVELYDIDQTTTARAQASTSGGAWSFDHSTSGRFDVKITDGSNIIWLRARDQFQVTTLQARSLTTAVPAGHFMSTTDEAATLVAVFAGRRATETAGVETAANQADGDIAYIDLELANDNATPQQFIAARLAWEAVDVSDGTEDGQFNFWTMVAGTLTEEWHSDATAIFPEANDGLALGKTTIAFSDLFLASGSVLDFFAGDVTFTHSAGTLTIGGDGAVVVAFDADTDISFTGTTGTNDITLTDSLADALSITRGGTDMVVFDSNTPRITFTPVTTFTGLITSTGGITFPDNADVAFTGATGTNDIVLVDGLADALSITDGSVDIVVIDTSAVGNVLTITAALAVAGDYTANNAAGPSLQDEVATATNPTLIPNRAELDTGIGWTSTDTLNFILGGATEGTWTTTALSPGASNGNALGTASLQWADLFLASGAVINFASSNVRITHAAGELAIKSATGTNMLLEIDSTDSNNATSDAILRFSEAGGGRFDFQSDGSANVMLFIGDPGGGATTIWSTGLSGPFTVEVNLLANVGIRIGADSGDNEIDDAAQGSASTTLFIGDTAIALVSDASVKENIADWEGSGLALVNSIPVKEFDYLLEHRPIGSNPSRHVGITAQDLRTVMPWAVHTQGGGDCVDCLAGTGCSEHKPWQVKFDLATGVLVRAIQELSAKLEALNAA